MFKQQMFLLNAGVPFDKLDMLEQHEMFAMTIVLQELRTGRQYDWDLGEWLD